jgi:predicted dehydrogenase
MRAGQGKLTAPLRVAGAGAGYFSAFHYDAWSRNPDVELAGIADGDLAKAQAMAERHGVSDVFASLDRMIEAVQPDLVDIITPPPSHYALIDMSSAAGLPVI